jgi:SAM-dependent methyltransferase
MSGIAPRRRKPALSAKSADRHALYERSVQSTEPEITFITRIFRREHGRLPLTLREDFCGSAILCADWVKSHAERRAIGVDLDGPTLAYARRVHIAPLGEAARRVRLFQRNVLARAPAETEVVVAFNFSYCVLKRRVELLEYFRNVHRGLARGGAFLLDIYGGPDAQNELIEKKAVGGFTYVWEQAPLDALTNHAVRYIHFHFKDGSEIRRAFTYDWRIWSLAELREALAEAGFSRVDVYWEGADAKGGGNGIFRRVAKAENEQSWIAYVVAWR